MTSLHELLGNTANRGFWRLVPERSTLSFKNKTLWGLLYVKGRFTEFTGDGQITDDGRVQGQVEARAASLKTGIGKRDEHLRSADFFDVERFPDLKVVVSEAEPTGPDTATLKATMTIRGVTRPIELPATVRMLDDGAIQIAAGTQIDRHEFGVAGNQIGMVTATTTVAGDLVFQVAQSNSTT